ncbi:MAG: hypothetical protein H7Z18_12530 [Methylophilaceae bacterium]|nr:hypothetical protein [Methylophilaceae bacterium]
MTTKHLALILNNDALTVKKRIDYLSVIDDHTLPRAEKLTYQFAKSGNLRADLELSMTNAAFNYYRQSYLNYLRLIELLTPAPLDSNIDHNALLILIANVVSISINMLKWRYFDHVPAPANMWLQLFKLYEIADKKNMLNIPIQAFGTVFENAPSSTISAYIMQVSILGTLENTNMQRMHFQTAVYLLNTWLNNVEMATKFDESAHLFVIDLKKDASAKRIRHFTTTSSCRYCHIDALESKLTNALQLTGQGKIPEDLALTEVGDVKNLRETLQILSSEWSKSHYVRQRRKEERQGIEKTAAIAYGILDICNQVEHYLKKTSNVGLNILSNRKSFDEKLSSHTSIRRESSINILQIEPQREAWTISDESPRGLGATTSKESKTWLKTGRLVGLAMDERPPRVVLALVRAVMPMRDLDKLHVGLEVIARFANWAHMRAIEPQAIIEPTNKFAPLAGSNSISMGFNALYCPIEAGLSEESTLILPKVEYRQNEIYEITVNRSTKLIKLGSPVDAKDDWVKVVFPHVAVG